MSRSSGTPHDFIPSQTIPNQSYFVRPAPDEWGFSSAGAPSYARIQAWLLARIADSLQVQPDELDPEQSFATYGLESIEAFSIAGDLADWLGGELSATLLWEYPTIDSIARHLSAPQDEAITESEAAAGTSFPATSRAIAWPSLRAIQPYGTRIPFYCVHGIGGSVLHYHRLARHLGQDQPFYAFQFPVPADGQPVGRSVEEMAESYLGELLAFQPEGPYLLGGTSLGGIIAFEMARQLDALGHEIGMVALLDSVCPNHERPLSRRQWFLLHSRRFLQQPPRKHLAYTRYLPGLTRIKAERQAGLIMEQFSQRTGRALPAVFRKIHIMNWVAAQAHVPQPYTGRVTFFRATGRLGTRYDSCRGWQHVALGGVERVDIPGDHTSFLSDEKNVQILAAQLNQRLQRAQSAHPAEVMDS